jgi:hypothetical protein
MIARLGGRFFSSEVINVRGGEPHDSIHQVFGFTS